MEHDIIPIDPWKLKTFQFLIGNGAQDRTSINLGLLYKYMMFQFLIGNGALNTMRNSEVRAFMRQVSIPYR